MIRHIRQHLVLFFFFINTLAKCFIRLFGWQTPASQNSSEVNCRRVCGCETAGPLIARHSRECALCELVDGDMFRGRGKKKQNTCSVPFCTSAQSFEMQMTMAYWKIVVFWDKWALQELKPCFSLQHSEATFCMMHSDCVFVYTHKYDKAFDFVFILNSKQKRMTFSLCAGLICQPVPHFSVCLLCAAQCRS